MALALGGCGPANEDPGAGGVTTGEAKALNEAAEMLDKQRPANIASPAGAPLPPTTSRH